MHARGDSETLPMLEPRRPLRSSWSIAAAIAVIVALVPGLAAASGGGGGAHAVPPTWMAAFFIVMLLGIAIIPLSRFEHMWHSNLNKLIFGLALSAYPVIWLVVLEPNT